MASAAPVRERERERERERSGGPLLLTALQYAQRGLAVLPTDVSKRPRTAHGVKDATTDATTIRSWWSRWPDAGVGLATGVVVVIIDVDPRNGGEESLAALECEQGALADTPRVLTGSHPGSGRGTHYYFQMPEGVTIPCGVLAPGVDVKGRGGYVVAPPSAHPSGLCYEWDAGSPATLAPLPAWIVARMTEPAKTAARTGGILGSLAHRFEAAGMLGRRIDFERFAVTCPWASQHSTGKLGDSSTVVFVPGAGRRRGWFHCSHSHCAGRTQDEVWRALGPAVAKTNVADTTDITVLRAGVEARLARLGVKS